MLLSLNKLLFLIFNKKQINMKNITFLLIAIGLLVMGCNPKDTTPKITISSISPDSADAGSKIVIKGSGFPTNKDISVVFGNVPTTPSKVTSTEIEVIVPNQVPRGDITVIVDKKETRAGFFVPKSIIDDRDNQKYPIVFVQGVMWMAKNLNYDIKETTIEDCYNSDDANCAQYGKLYPPIYLPSNPCPNGWKIPTYVDMLNLVSAFGPNEKDKLIIGGSSGLNLQYTGCKDADRLPPNNFVGLGQKSYLMISETLENTSGKGVVYEINSLNNGLVAVENFNTYNSICIRCIKK